MPYKNPEIPVSAAALDITFTGTPVSPIYIGALHPTVVIPVATSPARAVYRPDFGPSAGHIVYKENLVANTGLTAITFHNLVSAEGIILSNLPVITTISFTTLKYLTCNVSGMGTNISNCPLLTSLSFPELLGIAQGFNVSGNALLATLSAPKLIVVEANVDLGTMAALTSLTMNSLTFVGGNFAPTVMALLTTLTATSLASIGGTFAPATMAALTTLSFPALGNIAGAVSAASMAALTTINFAAMVNYGSTIAFNTSLGNLTTVTLGTIGTLKSIQGATINISGQKLTQAVVDAILALLVSLDGTNGTTTWGAGKTLTISGGTNAAPGVQGALDKITLQGRGATITTN